MNKNLVKTYAGIHRSWSIDGDVEYIVERYADPRKPNITKLWVVNGEHEFRRQKDCNAFCWRLEEQVDRVVGSVTKTYTQEAYNQAFK
jgi:hypothetical protein